MAVLTARQRRRSATVKPSRGYPSGRFPMPDKEHARKALQMLSRAKNLSPEERRAIKRRARAKLGHDTATTKRRSRRNKRRSSSRR